MKWKRVVAAFQQLVTNTMENWRRKTRYMHLGGWDFLQKTGDNEAIASDRYTNSRNHCMNPSQLMAIVRLLVRSNISDHWFFLFCFGMNFAMKLRTNEKMLNGSFVRFGPGHRRIQIEVRTCVCVCSVCAPFNRFWVNPFKCTASHQILNTAVQFSTNFHELWIKGARAHISVILSVSALSMGTQRMCVIIFRIIFSAFWCCYCWCFCNE